MDLTHVIQVDAYATGPPAALGTVKQDHDNEHDHANHNHDQHGPEPTHYELRGISSLQVNCPTLDTSRIESLDTWIRTVLWEGTLPEGNQTSNIQVLRSKGLFYTTAGEQYVLQGVRGMYDLSKGERDEMGVTEVGKIVLIGKGLNDVVRKSLEKVLG